MNIGLIGCGLWGANILRDLVQLGCGVHVSDIDETCRSSAKSLGAQSTCTLIQDLPQVQGYVVATPATTHREVIEQLIPNRVPIFTEKPFTTDIASAKRILEAGKGLVFVMHVWRYHPGIEMLAAIARSRELGRVEMLRTTRTNWTSPRRDIDSIWTLAPHDLSIALEILGHIPEPRFAVAERNGGQPCGLLGILGESPRVVLEVSSRYGDRRREVRLHCEDGVAVLQGEGTGQLVVTRGRTTDRELEPAREHRSLEDTPALYRELSAFVGHLKGGPPPKSSAEEGLMTVTAMVRLRSLAGL
jgi:predicted dehydrogenase